MFANRTRVLLVLSQDVMDRARVYVGQATIMLKLPVSLQIVLRALIEEGLGWPDNPALLAKVEAQARAVRRIRSAGRPGGRGVGEDGDRHAGIRGRPRVRERQEAAEVRRAGDTATRRVGASGSVSGQTRQRLS